MRYVILPQAVKLVVPPLTNEFIAMIKDTSLMSVIAVPEILFTAKEKMGVVANPTPLTVAAIIYVVFTIPLIRLAARLENRRRKRSRWQAASRHHARGGDGALRRGHRRADAQGR